MVQCLSRQVGLIVSRKNSVLKVSLMLVTEVTFSVIVYGFRKSVVGFNGSL